MTRAPITVKCSHPSEDISAIIFRSSDRSATKDSSFFYFHHPAWAEAVIKHWERPRKGVPLLITAHCSGEIAGWWHLIMSKRTAGYRLQNLGQEISDYAFPYVASTYAHRRDEIVELMLRTLLGFRKDFSFAQFQGFLYPPDPFLPHTREELASWLSGVSDDGWAIGSGRENLIIDLRPFKGNWEDFTDRQISPRFRKNLRMDERKLLGKGHVKTRRVSRQADMDQLQQFYFSWYRYGKQDDSRTRQKLETWWEFYSRTSEDILCLDVMTLNDVPASIIIGFKRGGQFDFFSPVFNPEFRSLGVGKIHLWYFFRTLLEEGCDQFNFMVGGEPYKQHWAATGYQCWGVKWYHTGTPLAVLHRIKNSLRTRSSNKHEIK